MKTLRHQDKAYLKIFLEKITKDQELNILKWIEALESGNYQQCKRHLKDYDAYCCLGVANEVLNLGVDSALYSTLGSAGERIALLFSNGTTILTRLNDVEGWTFMDIANLLRDQLKLSKVVQTV